MNVLSVRKYHAGKRHLFFPLHRVPDHDEGICARLSVGHDIVRLVQIALVDILGGNKVVDLYRVGAFDLDGGKLILLDLHVAPLGELVTPPLVFFFDDSAGFLVHHLLLQPMAHLSVDLVEVSFFRLRGRWVERDGACHQR